MNPIALMFVGGGMLLLPFLSLEPSATQPGEDALVATAHAGFAENRYIGQKACKNCHATDAKGAIHEKWAASKHAKAFETLGTPEAKKIAAELKIDDPQKSEKCLECHVTAFGVNPKTGIKKGFATEDGVQCESCHGPGEDHFKKRMKESMGGGEPSPVEPGEITTQRSMELCGRCHNERSPTYKEFCLKERMAVIEHFDPRKGRTEEELQKIRDTCDPNCPKCSKKKDG